MDLLDTACGQNPDSNRQIRRWQVPQPICWPRIRELRPHSRRTHCVAVAQGYLSIIELQKGHVTLPYFYAYEAKRQLIYRQHAATRRTPSPHQSWPIGTKLADLSSQGQSRGDLLVARIAVVT